MADPKDDDFLDDLDALEAEAEAEEEAFETAEPTEADRIAELEAERDEYRDKFMRALADAENARKRSDRDRREAEQYGSTRLARDLLPVYDNLQRALAAANEEQKQISAALLEGVELTLKELLSVFKKHGIEVITPAVGDRFDPKIHEAMFEAPLPETKAGDIIQVSAEGFMLYDRLLRPAQVGVSSNPG
ncbi:molecular chaperone GrpE [Roseivivax halotolerans]|jgi:molecular chaperone GrpE|uniref:Protein GrpE n=1 Tax=Roseivivax halotolerans TaxID=93684 RepID=A0A1I5VC90_9RHOB|nr:MULTISPECIES: nucleotide exchange factor GrpE [Roseivivax]QFT64926.1 heat shock protein GrpE [Roseivivax sp. THAF30]SFQ05095.1 molecular chaperone GrpE [Roseivivax halotolerans]